LPWRGPRADVNTLNLKNPVACATGFFFRVLKNKDQDVSQGDYWLEARRLERQEAKKCRKGFA
jgi:hypothetical protein